MVGGEIEGFSDSGGKVGIVGEVGQEASGVEEGNRAGGVVKGTSIPHDH